jgi:hypothetical protein
VLGERVGQQADVRRGHHRGADRAEVARGVLVLPAVVVERTPGRPGGIGGAAAGSPDHQGSGDPRAAGDGVAGEPRGQDLDGPFTELGERHRHRGQRRIDLPGFGGVVEADHGDLAGHVDPAFPHQAQGVDGEEVAARHQGVEVAAGAQPACVQDHLGGRDAGVAPEVRRCGHQPRIERDAVPGQRVDVRAVTLRRDGVRGRPLDEREPLPAVVLDEVRDRFAHAPVAVQRERMVRLQLAVEADDGELAQPAQQPAGDLGVAGEPDGGAPADQAVQAVRRDEVVGLVPVHAGADLVARQADDVDAVFFGGLDDSRPQGGAYPEVDVGRKQSECGATLGGRRILERRHLDQKIIEYRYTLKTSAGTKFEEYAAKNRGGPRDSDTPRFSSIGCRTGPG